MLDRFKLTRGIQLKLSFGISQSLFIDSVLRNVVLQSVGFVGCIHDFGY